MGSRTVFLHLALQGDRGPLLGGGGGCVRPTLPWPSIPAADASRPPTTHCPQLLSSPAASDLKSFEGLLGAAAVHSSVTLLMSAFQTCSCLVSSSPNVMNTICAPVVPIQFENLKPLSS